MIPTNEETKQEQSSQPNSSEKTNKLPRPICNIDLSKIPTDFKYKMIILVRTDLGMDKGKIGAQCGHGVAVVYKKIITSENKAWIEALKEWEESGQAKIVLKVKDEDELIKAYWDAENAGIVTGLIQDAGRTQIKAGEFTVVAIGPAKVEDLAFTKSFKLL